jgi:peptide-methionine (R)-S-oxide reductase
MVKYIIAILLSILILMNMEVNLKAKDSSKTRDIKKSAQNAEKIRLFNVDKGITEELKKVTKSDKEWRRLLTAEQFQITRKKDTETPFTGEYAHHNISGIYKCVACGTDLFRSEAKFESGTGWPSFWQPVAKENVQSKIDSSFFMQRTEIICSRCGAHLGMCSLTDQLRHISDIALILRF